MPVRSMPLVIGAGGVGDLEAVGSGASGVVLTSAVGVSPAVRLTSRASAAPDWLTMAAVAAVPMCR